MIDDTVYKMEYGVLKLIVIHPALLAEKDQIPTNARSPGQETIKIHGCAKVQIDFTILMWNYP
jgi:hypothetical protein